MTDLGYFDPENGAITKTQNMIVENIYMVIDKTGCMSPDNGHYNTGNNNPDISNVIESSGLGCPNRDLDVTTQWAMFPAPAL